ncbi:MAG: DUF86 domain-containing protein [Promethearchaeota archaeon]|nr:MAG: DUF86 domain-containing protein [Candidatus Lokiarchaeota archaeon]
MVEKSRQRRYKEKLERLREYKLLFEKWFSSKNFQTLKKQNNFEKIFAIYHSIQLMVEVITDIVCMMLKDLSIIVQDNYTNLEKLLKNEIISPEMFQGLKKLNGLRNRIVHDYNGIIDEIIWASIEENRKFIDQFENVVNKWLSKQI